MKMSELQARAHELDTKIKAMEATIAANRQDVEYVAELNSELHPLRAERSQIRDSIKWMREKV